VKRAMVRQRRTLADGRRLVSVACPWCSVRHWTRAGSTGTCPRLGRVFVIIGGNR
jgi:hypothetical protein